MGAAYTQAGVLAKGRASDSAEELRSWDASWDRRGTLWLTRTTRQANLSEWGLRVGAAYTQAREVKL